MTQANKVCAWIDVSDGLDPESAAANGVELSRLLWVRCGISDAPRIVPVSQPAFVLPEKYFAPPPIKKGLHGGGFGSHPRDEIKGFPALLAAFSDPKRPFQTALNCKKSHSSIEPQNSFQLLQCRANVSLHPVNRGLGSGKHFV